MRLTAQSHSPQRPVWVIIDELASLQKLPSLLLGITESRKSNTRMVLGFQSKSLLEKHYGEEAKAILSQPARVSSCAQPKAAPLSGRAKLLGMSS